MHVGIARPYQRAGGGVEQLGNVDHPEPERGEHQHRSDDEGQMQARGRLETKGGRPGDDVAPEEVERHQDDHGERRQPGQESECRGNGGKGEHIPPDVPSEHRVLDPERRGVGGLKHRFPRRAGREPAQQAEQQRQRERQPSEHRRDVDVGHRLAHPEHHRIGDDPPLGGAQVDVEHHGSESARRQEEDGPGEQLAGEYDLVPDLLEPPPLGEEPGQGGEEQDGAGQGGDEEQGDDSSTGHGILQDASDD